MLKIAWLKNKNRLKIGCKNRLFFTLRRLIYLIQICTCVLLIDFFNGCSLVSLVLVIKCLGGRFEIYCSSKSRGWFIPKIARTKHVVNGLSRLTNKHFILKLIYLLTAAVYKSTSGKLQDNSVKVQCWLQLTVWLKK